VHDTVVCSLLLTGFQSCHITRHLNGPRSDSTYSFHSRARHHAGHLCTSFISPQVVKHFPLEPCPHHLIISSSFPGLRVSRPLEVSSSTPPNFVLLYKLNAVDYMGNPTDFLRYGTMKFGVASIQYNLPCNVDSNLGRVTQVAARSRSRPHLA
jgi:hypothetical protein